MEKLSAEKQAEIKKMASERIKQLLLKAGFKERQLKDMFQALAEVWLKKKQKKNVPLEAL